MRFSRNIVLNIRNHREAAENNRENGRKIDAFGGQISDVADDEDKCRFNDTNVDRIPEFLY